MKKISKAMIAKHQVAKENVKNFLTTYRNDVMAWYQFLTSCGFKDDAEYDENSLKGFMEALLIVDMKRVCFCQNSNDIASLSFEVYQQIYTWAEYTGCNFFASNMAINFSDHGVCSNFFAMRDIENPSVIRIPSFIN